MELTIALIISIIGAVMGVLSFAFSRKDKSNKLTGDSQYKMGVLENKVDNISKQLDKILEKLDTYDVEIDNRIALALKHHINEYHKGE